VLASGELEDSFTEYMQAENALFIDTFDGTLATALYAAGELLLLPSYFEPCGISQLIAMRYGCLPVVHEIGGLHDTVRNRRTGFCYGGVNLAGQQKALLRALDAALKLHREDPTGWNGMMREAMEERFTWTGPTKIYQQLYGQLLGMPVGK
jgi:starch synthase